MIEASTAISATSTAATAIEIATIGAIIVGAVGQIEELYVAGAYVLLVEFHGFGKGVRGVEFALAFAARTAPIARILCKKDTDRTYGLKERVYVIVCAFKGQPAHFQREARAHQVCVRVTIAIVIVVIVATVVIIVIVVVVVVKVVISAVVAK